MQILRGNTFQTSRKANTKVLRRNVTGTFQGRKKVGVADQTSKA